MWTWPRCRPKARVRFVEIRKKLGLKARRKLWEERYEGDVFITDDKDSWTLDVKSPGILTISQFAGKHM